MMRKIGLMLLYALHAVSLWGAADSGAQGLPHFSEQVSFVLQRLVNPKAETFDMLTGGGGTHNLVQFSCMQGGVGCHGLLGAGEEYDGINIPIPVDRKNISILLAVAKRRFSIFQAEPGSRELIVHEFGRSNEGRVIPEVKLTVESLSDPAYAACPIILEICHGASFTAKVAQAGKSKRIQATSPVSERRIHMPPAFAPHQHSCPCADCVAQLSQVPTYPAPTCPPGVPFTLSSDPYKR